MTDACALCSANVIRVQCTWALGFNIK